MQIKVACSTAQEDKADSINWAVCKVHGECKPTSSFEQVCTYVFCKMKTLLRSARPSSQTSIADGQVQEALLSGLLDIEQTASRWKLTVSFKATDRVRQVVPTYSYLVTLAHVDDVLKVTHRAQLRFEFARPVPQPKQSIAA